MTAICSTMGTTLLWRLKKRGSERGADNAYPWLEASKKCLIWGKGSDRIEGAMLSISVQATAPLCGGFGVFGVVFWRAPPSVESGAYRGAKTLDAQAENPLTDLHKRTAVLTPAK